MSAFPSTMNGTDWREASRREPCPVCEKPDWCCLTGPEGAIEAAVCMRVQSSNPRPNGGWAHKLRDDPLAYYDPPRPRPATSKAKETRSYASLSEASSYFVSKYGQPTGEWEYFRDDDAGRNGIACGVVLRWDPAGEDKVIRQFTQAGGTWQCTHMPAPRPLYNLLGVADRPGEIVLIVEGESAADALTSVGQLAVTSSGGAKAPDKTDWSPLAGRNVVVWGDNDPDGRAYVEKVTELLSVITNPPRIRTLTAPDLIDGSPMPTKGDAVDWINNHGDAAEPQVIAGNLQAIIDASSEWNPDDAEPAADEVPPAVTYQLITCRELAAGDYKLEYLIENAMVAGQPLIIAGQQKTLKTSFIIAAAIALATAGYFLGKLLVGRAARVAVMSGESGLATIQETAFRIAAAAGHHLADIDNLFWSPDVPKFGDLDHLEAIERFLVENKIEVLFIDPAYLCLPSADSGNLMAQGELLRGMAAICQRLGVTMVLAHHTKKNTATPAGDPPELSDIAWAGFAEFARQWWLIGRREKYKPGSGEHKLWLSVGGSAGHSGLWGVDVSEGVYSPHTPRTWDVEVRPSSEVFEEKADDREQRKQAKAAERKAEQLDSDCRQIVAVMTRLGRAETKSVIRDAAQITGSRANAAFCHLEADGTVRSAEVTRDNNQKYGGYELCQE